MKRQTMVLCQAVGLTVLLMNLAGCGSAPPQKQVSMSEPQLVEATAEKKPGWVTQGQKTSSSNLYFVGVATGYPRREEAIETAEQRAMGDIVEYFGQEGTTLFKSRVTYDGKQVSDEVFLKANKHVSIEQARIAETYLEKWLVPKGGNMATYRYDAYALVEYPKKSFNAEKQRLAKKRKMRERLKIGLDVTETALGETAQEPLILKHLQQYLSNAGYTLYEGKMPEPTSGEPSLISTGPISVLVTVTAETTPGGKYKEGSDIQYVVGSASMQAVRLSDHKVLASKEILKERGFDQDPKRASRDALDRMAETFAKYLVDYFDNQF